jgi:hypothetical protein
LAVEKKAEEMGDGANVAVNYAFPEATKIVCIQPAQQNLTDLDISSCTSELSSIKSSRIEFYLKRGQSYVH